MTDLTPAALAEGERPTCKQSLQVQTYADFLTEAARYFSRRPTDGEDSAFWANHSNADTCLRIRDALLTAARDAARYREALELIWPFFEGEHYYDHPDSVKVRAALAREREG